MASNNNRVARRLQRLPGVRAVARPITAGQGVFDLHYVRGRPRRPSSGPPVLIIPGGPGVASVAQYTLLRRRAVARGLDVLMVEHRGVGLSRRDRSGADLPAESIDIVSAIDDLAACLDDAGIDQVVVHGCSYGTYLAQGFGVRHPDRVAAMVLDSPMLSAQDGRVVREHLRSTLLSDDAGRRVRELRAAGRLPEDPAAAVPQLVYEFAGHQAWRELLRLLADGRGQRLYERLLSLATRELDRVVPYAMEFDLVGRIAFRELNAGGAPDGQPFDPDVTFAALLERYGEFEAEPFDLTARLPSFDWPVVVVVGDRDLRTPVPIAAQVADLAPHSVLVTLPGHGHSALDFHPLAALMIDRIVAAGRSDRLPELAPRIAALPRPYPNRVLTDLLRLGLWSARLGVG